MNNRDYFAERAQASRAKAAAAADDRALRRIHFRFAEAYENCVKRLDANAVAQLLPLPSV